MMLTSARQQQLPWLPTQRLMLLNGGTKAICQAPRLVPVVDRGRRLNALVFVVLAEVFIILIAYVYTHLNNIWISVPFSEKWGVYLER